MAKMKNKVILITGAAGGIGSATARRFVEQGAKVVLADVDTTALAEEQAGLQAAAKAKGHGEGNVHSLEVDVTDPAACQRAVSEAVEHYGRLDVVWANAGISIFGPMQLVEADRWRRLIDINLLGAYNVIQAGLEEVIKAKGHIAITASWASFAHSPGHSAYAAAKAGVEAMANALRVEVADPGVTVGVLHPGWINTSLVTKKIDDHPAFNVYMESLPKPLAQLSDVEELAEVLAKGIAKRKAKVIYPRLGWGLHAIRALLPTPLLSAGQRKAAPRMREEFRKNPR